MKCKSCHRDMIHVKAPRYGGVYAVVVLAIGMGVPIFLVYSRPGLVGLGAAAYRTLWTPR